MTSLIDKIDTANDQAAVDITRAVTGRVNKYGTLSLCAEFLEFADQDVIVTVTSVCAAEMHKGTIMSDIMTLPTIVKRALDVVDRLKGKPNRFELGPARLAEGLEFATSSCSSLLSWLLDYPRQIRARDFGARILPRARVQDIREGDIGAIIYSEDRDGMSGHCFLIVSTPSQARTGEWVIGVVDSCRTSHGAGDTRESAPGGIGRGYMTLLTGDDGIVTGYKWALSPLSKRMLNGPDERIVVGVLP